jgi:CDGSH iron-sulfur domain-containing protein 3
MTRFEHDEAPSHPEVIEFGAGTYHWCQCGRIRIVPYCDGSHKGSGVQPLSFEVAEPITSAICSCGLTDNPPYCSGAHVGIE